MTRYAVVSGFFSVLVVLVQLHFECVQSQSLSRTGPPSPEVEIRHEDLDRDGLLFIEGGGRGEAGNDRRIQFPAAVDGGSGPEIDHEIPSMSSFQAMFFPRRIPPQPVFPSGEIDPRSSTSDETEEGPSFGIRREEDVRPLRSDGHGPDAADQRRDRLIDTDRATVPRFPLLPNERPVSGQPIGQPGGQRVVQPIGQPRGQPGTQGSGQSSGQLGVNVPIRSTGAARGNSDQGLGGPRSNDGVLFRRPDGIPAVQDKQRPSEARPVRPRTDSNPAGVVRPSVNGRPQNSPNFPEGAAATNNRPSVGVPESSRPTGSRPTAMRPAQSAAGTININNTSVSQTGSGNVRVIRSRRQVGGPTQSGHNKTDVVQGSSSVSNPGNPTGRKDRNPRLMHQSPPASQPFPPTHIHSPNNTSATGSGDIGFPPKPEAVDGDAKDRFPVGGVGGGGPMAGENERGFLNDGMSEADDVTDQRKRIELKDLICMTSLSTDSSKERKRKSCPDGRPCSLGPLNFQLNSTDVARFYFCPNENKLLEKLACKLGDNGVSSTPNAPRLRVCRGSDSACNAGPLLLVINEAESTLPTNPSPSPSSSSLSSSSSSASSRPLNVYFCDEDVLSALE